MRFKFGALIGFAAGYYLGAKAGRERYDQINAWIDQAMHSEPVSSVTGGRQDDGTDDTADLGAGVSAN